VESVPLPGWKPCQAFSATLRGKRGPFVAAFEKGRELIQPPPGLRSMGVWEYGSMGVWEYGSMGVKISLHPHMDTPIHPYFLPKGGEFTPCP